MPNIKKIKLESKIIKGFETRTKNVNEMNPETQKIAPLWGKYFTEIFHTLKEDKSLYGVYHNYESDAQGEFDVLVGAEEGTESLSSVHIEEGNYLVFPAKGEMPQAIIDTWARVWAYFEDPSIDERRAFKTDYEMYISSDEAEVVIGVHYL